MSPAARRTRTRRYDPARTRAAVTAQFAHVREAVHGLTDEQLVLPTRLGGWTVRELVAHLEMAVGSVVRLLAEPAPARQETALLDWPFATAAGAAGIDVDTRALAAASAPGTPHGLDALLARAADRLAGILPQAPDDRLVASRAGAMRLDDYLVTRCVELVVHTDDLAAATGADIPYDRQALATATRLLADALAAKAPGGSVEVRVPPFAVVQCVEGPKHTRGTPPNVVETDPLTWLRLATGRAAWAEELAAATVHASGERADIGDQLPVLS
ncbi:maleylpyruvate isomerase family mycothiol-dependent enzyme [Streptomyces pinistramenti]|uniref:maleylpyruvate isomerase family mycothiol-dependent enzyme n=1 Tax=Streptomyces pinistramenti TaxID=2884812 RepID=UPI001D05CF58|nr:maleylpyruvate isomerase family mycothiol-dependent enzyme [Streptomyces pinistramenti]MCB5910984.1 maleylpyruvate isomerase family mycothiol-dependent enzyme [Streptomyces pinistramenti]